MPIEAENILEFFDSPAEAPFVIEHRHEDFTSVCPLTGHPDFGVITVRYCPAAVCVELKSLKLSLLNSLLNPPVISVMFFGISVFKYSTTSGSSVKK